MFEEVTGAGGTVQLKISAHMQTLFGSTHIPIGHEDGNLCDCTRCPLTPGYLVVRQCKDFPIVLPSVIDDLLISCRLHGLL